MTTVFKKKIGTREQVWKDLAYKTSGGLRKKDLTVSKTGKLVSKKASDSAKNRMSKGKGICDYCIKLYKGEVKETKETKVRELKEKKITGASPERIKELEKEIEALRKKAHRIAERENRVTKEAQDLLKQVAEKTRERVKMVKALRAKNKNKTNKKKK